MREDITNSVLNGIRSELPHASRDLNTLAEAARSAVWTDSRFTDGFSFYTCTGISFVDCRQRDRGSPEGVAATFYTPHDVDPLYNSRQGRDDDAERQTGLATRFEWQKSFCANSSGGKEEKRVTRLMADLAMRN